MKQQATDKREKAVSSSTIIEKPGNLDKQFDSSFPATFFFGDGHKPAILKVIVCDIQCDIALFYNL